MVSLSVKNKKRTHLDKHPEITSYRRANNKFKLDVFTQNAQGFTSTRQDKKDCIAAMLRKTSRPTVALIQETWEKQSTNMEVDGILFLNSGNPTDSRKYGGVSIALSRQAQIAW